MEVYLLLRIGQTRVAPRRSGYVEIEFYDFYKLTSSIISNNQISRRGGIILDEMMMMISIHGSAIQNICTFRQPIINFVTLPRYRPSAGREQACIPDHLHPYTEFKRFDSKLFFSCQYVFKVNTTFTFLLCSWLKLQTHPSMKSLPLCSAAMAFSSGRPTRSTKHKAGSARIVLYFS